MRGEKKMRRVFVRKDGVSMAFFMLPSKERSQLKPLIEKHGGKFVSTSASADFKLAANNQAVTGTGFLRTAFVEKCIQQRQIVDTGPFYFKLPSSVPKKRTKYTEAEDMAIIQFCLNHKRSSWKTLAVFQEMECKQIVPGRSAQSLHERMRRYILPRVQRGELRIPLTSLASAQQDVEDIEDDSDGDQAPVLQMLRNRGKVRGVRRRKDGQEDDTRVQQPPDDMEDRQEQQQEQADEDDDGGGDDDDERENGENGEAEGGEMNEGKDKEEKTGEEKDDGEEDEKREKSGTNGREVEMKDGWERGTASSQSLEQSRVHGDERQTHPHKASKEARHAGTRAAAECAREEDQQQQQAQNGEKKVTDTPAPATAKRKSKKRRRRRKKAKAGGGGEIQAGASSDITHAMAPHSSIAPQHDSVQPAHKGVMSQAHSHAVQRLDTAEQDVEEDVDGKSKAVNNMFAQGKSLTHIIRAFCELTGVSRRDAFNSIDGHCGDFTAAMRYVITGVTPGMWNPQDDSQLLSTNVGDVAAVKRKYGESMCIRRLKFLNPESDANATTQS